MKLLAAVSSAALGLVTLRLYAQAASPDDEIRDAIEKLHHARSVSPAESQAAFVRILSIDYVGVAPDGSFETRTEVVARSEKRNEPSIAIEDERIHVFRDDSGRARTAIVTGRARHEYATGVSYTQDLYVFRNDGRWLAIAGREMPVTAGNVLSIPIDLNASSTSSHQHGNHPDDRALREDIHKFAWASVLSELGSPEEQAKAEFANQTLADDSLRISENGSVMGKRQWNRRRAQADARSILYENVLVHFFGETAVVTYRSKYEGMQGMQWYYLLLRVYMKRAGKWEMLAGQGFPLRLPTKN